MPWSRRRVLGLVAVAAGCRPPEMPPSAPTSLLGEAAPQFSRRGLDGRVVDLAALRDRVVVVEFFARYCEPCWRHLPKVQRWAARQRDVAVIGIGADEFAGDTQAMVRALGVAFPVVHDSGLVLTARFRVDKIPSTLVLDRGGRVRWRSLPGDGVSAMDRAVAAVRSARD
ncbi:TlpA disulfide reductase family protein [Nannocystis sp. RBIL2]|uniref:TlpA family protein disulfide reductase n=1 Tax=Nannocystis sp. RBIL2 TaxID=2996788 RepID=UPI002271F64F|nr:TlpA disulfide reductase family protein [Nannocystis sp. RBIL2]